MPEDPPYKMSINLNVLNHLGINLYSNIPAVISEVVANAYDADAETVTIEIDTSRHQVVIKDDGEGMDLTDINDRYLNVGYQRRNDNRAKTERFNRAVMGRKGIGKLSLFSIAETVEVHSTRSGQKHALRMTIDGIRQAIGDDAQNMRAYHPEPLPSEVVDFERGTRIVLTDLKKGLANVQSGLRKRLARRFSILGAEHSFRLFIDGEEVTIADRDYFHKLQYVWTYGPDEVAQAVVRRCINVDQSIPVSSEELADRTITGWIGTVKHSGSLKEGEGDNLNRISLMVRGKLAHEDLLEEINEGKIFRAYLIGELHADFLDQDDKGDIATSSRQRIIEDDPRYQELLKWLQIEITRIGSAWTEHRNSEGKKAAFENENIKEWFGTLGRDSRKKAERLFGKINQLTVDSERQRSELFSHAVLAFEALRYRDNLEALDDMEPQDIAAVTSLFKSIEDLEAALYYQIVVQRLRVIDKLREHVDNDALEKILQKHLFEHLWLLDPSWERATDRMMEERIGDTFAKINNQLTDEERLSRIDIRYKKVTGTHVIVELKRNSVVTDTYTLLKQVDKYRNALLRYLKDAGRDEPVEVVCVIGRDLRDWSNPNGLAESQNLLAAKKIRVLKYEQLLADAYAGYREYIDRQEELGRIRALLTELAENEDEAPPIGVATSAIKEKGDTTTIGVSKSIQPTALEDRDDGYTGTLFELPSD
ncbi:Histidine kinase-, DNA gyrase B-, and HSP90-like ATPase [Actinomadura meyerae]|uniref:Histidine kinase-, DNA gyrase B-, and HSP90-like ATPase n=1 Tax=Actinomadura meyerae TaxID=240840 RepID=A0A239DW98_9ACTN|nr:ATP-binding protein [Actinomadura meyerae]SNS35874.1 Histidine kinase-, DNA gyrase B-, and HSP90-like ATPase [Actinomadura meyerae]